MEKTRTLKENYLICDLCGDDVGCREGLQGYEMARTEEGDFCQRCREITLVKFFGLLPTEVKDNIRKQLKNNNEENES